MDAILYIFSGLPGTGKTVLSQFLSKRIGSAYLRIDTIEQSLRNRGMKELEDTGYRIAYQLSEDNLKLGLSVVADSVNPIEKTRTAWRNVAQRVERPYCEIEVLCSDEKEHRKRIESRTSDIPDLSLPGWEEVIQRKYDEWTWERIVIDTAGRTLEESRIQLWEQVKDIGLI